MYVRRSKSPEYETEVKFNPFGLYPPLCHLIFLPKIVPNESFPISRLLAVTETDKRYTCQRNQEDVLRTFLYHALAHVKIHTAIGYRAKIRIKNRLNTKYESVKYAVKISFWNDHADIVSALTASTNSWQLRKARFGVYNNDHRFLSSICRFIDEHCFAINNEPKPQNTRHFAQENYPKFHISTRTSFWGGQLFKKSRWLSNYCGTVG